MKFWDSSAIARLEREGNRAALAVQASLARLDLLAEAWAQVEPGPDLQRLARRLLRTHPQRAAEREGRALV